MANDMLDHGSGCTVLKQIRAITRAKLRHALALAKAVQTIRGAAVVTLVSAAEPVKLKEHALKTAAKLVA